MLHRFDTLFAVLAPHDAGSKRFDHHLLLEFVVPKLSVRLRLAQVDCQLEDFKSFGSKFGDLGRCHRICGHYL